MLIRTIALAVTAALAACATSEPVAETDDSIICGSLCDPGHDTYDDALYGAYDYARVLYPDALELNQNCINLGSAGAPSWDCFVTYTMDESPCLQLVVECNDVGGWVKCNHRENNCQF